MEIFDFDEDESFETRCGDIFLTTKGKIAIHCTFCDVLYKTFETFFDHLHDHIQKEGSPLFEDTNEEVEIEILQCDDDEGNYTINETLQTIEDKIEPLDNNEYSNCEALEDALQEEGMPINYLEETPKDNEVKMSKEKTNNSVSDEKLKCHNDENKLQFPEGRKVFYSLAEIELYVKSRTPHRSDNSCKKCGKSYSSASYLQKHSCVPNFCGKCKNLFKNAHTLKKHVCKERRGGNKVCTVCGRGFVNNATLKKHIDLKHGSLKTSKIKRSTKACPHCEKSFRTTFTLKRHISQKHERKKEDTTNGTLERGIDEDTE